MSTPLRFVLTLSCPDRIGIVAAVAGFLAAEGCNIVDSAQFGDPENALFFMRVSFAPRDPGYRDRLSSEFAKIADTFGMSWAIHASHDLSFHHLPVTATNKSAQEQKLTELMRDERIDLIVLARYMQVLSADFCNRFPSRIINIHHSFLPSFKGAKPYHQAFGRGVKLIGATAHYATEDLDEGPIIEQDTARVDHAMSAEDFVAVGRDVESIVLARAVKWHVEHRILPNGNRTVVFR